MLVIMITAYASIKTAVKATKSGAYDFLPKPFTPDQQFPVRFLRTHDDLNAVPKFYTYSDQNPDVLILYG